MNEFLCIRKKGERNSFRNFMIYQLFNEIFLRSCMCDFQKQKQKKQQFLLQMVSYNYILLEIFCSTGYLKIHISHKIIQFNMNTVWWYRPKSLQAALSFRKDWCVLTLWGLSSEFNLLGLRCQQIYQSEVQVSATVVETLTPNSASSCKPWVNSNFSCYIISLQVCFLHFSYLCSTLKCKF